MAKNSDKSDTFATPKKRAEFLALLSEYGNVSKSAEKAKVNRTSMYRYRKECPEFGKAWDEAESIGAKALEDEARRRAYEGTLKPVFHQGVECGAVREYSDTLLIFLLKGHEPGKYGDRQTIEHKGDIPLPSFQINLVDGNGKAVVKDAGDA